MMSAIPPSTPFPVPGLNSTGNNATPAEFLNFLRSLISKYLGDNCPRVTDDRKTWITIVDGLTDHLLGPFPLPEIVAWDAMEEKVVMTEVTLDVIRRVFLRVDGVFSDTETLVKKLFARLLDLCLALDVWNEEDITFKEECCSPAHMKEIAVVTVVAILRGLGECSPLVGDGLAPPWMVLRMVLLECIYTGQELISPSSPFLDVVFITLFQSPRINSSKDKTIAGQKKEDQEQGQDPLKIIVPSVFWIPSLLVLVIDLLIQVLVPPLKSQLFIADTVRLTTELSKSAFLYCLNPACSTTLKIRARSIMNLLLITKPFRQMQEYEGLMGGLPECVLRMRLESTVKLDWDYINPLLLKIFQTEHLPVSRGLTRSVVYRLQSNTQSEDCQDILWAYLRSVLPRTDPNLRKSLKEMLETLQDTPQKALLVSEIDAANAAPDSLVNQQKSTEGRLMILPHVWQQRVQDLVAQIMVPDLLTWMDDDNALPVSQIVQRALFELNNRFEGRSLDSWATQRLPLVKKIAELPCLLAQCDTTDCLSRRPAHKSLTVRSYIPVLTSLLHGVEEDVTVDLRKEVYHALSKALKHHNEDEAVDTAVDIVFKGLNDADRNVRVSAGYALKALVQVYSLSNDAGIRNVEPIFIRLYQCFEMTKNSIRETLLVAVGAMGKISNPGILGQVLCLLTAQLGRKNPVIKGSASMHILAIAKHHHMAPYKLIHPYQDQIAPFVIKRLPTQPDLLSEVCHVMSIAPADFITITLPRTLPEVFATCDQRVLDIITKTLSAKASTLLLKHCHGILAHIFLLPSQAGTTKALNFVIQVLMDATSSAIDIQSVVKSYVVPLLSELVVVMGDETHEVATKGIIALKRVQQILLQGKADVSVHSDLGAFLKTYMLGLISDINDMLQDVQGKKSVVTKRKIIRSLGALIQQIGPMINHVSPQIMATFQTMVVISELSEATLDSWFKFLTTLGSSELGPHLGPTSAAIVSSWPCFSSQARNTAFGALEYIICTMGTSIAPYLSDIIDLSIIEELRPLDEKLKDLRGSQPSEKELQRILKQAMSDNLTVASQALRELKLFMMHTHRDYIHRITSGDSFDPCIGQVLACLSSLACRDIGDGTDSLRLLAFECIGVLGAVDPDRVEIPYHNTSMVVMKNYADESEAILFALHLIQDLLVGAFRSTSDIKYQSHLAYSIQELLKICQFTPALVAAHNTTSIPIKVRHRWNALPKHVLETVTPLLEGRFTLNQSTLPAVQHPIYPTQSTYREWIQLWATYLITRVSGPLAQKLFGVFRSSVRNKDVVVAHHLLPHLVLNVLVSGNEKDAEDIRSELITVLNDQVDKESISTSDKKLLSAQAVFMLLDHLNKWIRIVRQEMSKKPDNNKRQRMDRYTVDLQEQLLRLDSVLANIDQSLMAKAAFQCRAFARSLMDFEQQIITLKERKSGEDDLPGFYEKLHEIYAHLDEPDGMEGISTLILAPTLEHQIREHESTGRWTSAQSCWELRLQESPDNVESHLGLLRCLRNLGHYDTLRTHVAGVLTRHPEWQTDLAGFQIESAWMVGAWDDVQKLTDTVKTQTPAVVTGKALLAMRSGETKATTDSLAHARLILGAPITAAGATGYRRSYQSALDLHLLHELELIYRTTSSLYSYSQDVGAHKERSRSIEDLSKTLSARLDTTLPTFRIREPLLSMRRTAFTLSNGAQLGLGREIGKSWLASAKIARKAGQWQTAYTATLQAKQRKASYAFIESAKLVKASGEPLRALHELENSVKFLGLFNDNVLDLTLDEDAEKMKAKIQVLRGRWMDESDRFDSKAISSVLEAATEFQKNWESAQYYFGQFHDDCYKTLSDVDKVNRGLKMNFYTIKAFSKSIMHGSKYTYRTVPRLLTIWLDLGETPLTAQQDHYKKMIDCVARAIQGAPVFKWFTAFPQIVSRVGHGNSEVFRLLSKLIIIIMQAYPRQSLWLFTSVVKSTKQTRARRGKDILRQLQSNPVNQGNGVAGLVSESLTMTNELLGLCDYHITENKFVLSMSKQFPQLKKLGRSKLIIPLQESLTASLPPDPFSESTHKPFPLNIPTFHEFADEIEIMKSLAKPRKITIRGSNGQVYMFLGKPKDDLRKDARLMEMNSIINKLLKGNSESRRRQLHIRTYGVVALNEECGFIQWVPNTTAVRTVLLRYYEARGIKQWNNDMNILTTKMKDLSDENGMALYKEKILSVFKPVFHEWFIETFPEPTAWLASRLAYGRTAAVMSMVGFILGLGDRHGENILLDTNSGDVVHVDFNCLFERGKTLETPERVPFRLTPNVVDGLGISGVEGLFRIACEVTMQLLRDNKDSLMNVLDAFIHDPLVEWEDEKRKRDRDIMRKGSGNPDKIEITDLAKNALYPIEKKLKGMYVPYIPRERQERPMSTSNLVQLLIQDATDMRNLMRMYAGWTPWH